MKKAKPTYQSNRVVIRLWFLFVFVLMIGLSSFAINSAYVKDVQAQSVNEQGENTRSTYWQAVKDGSTGYTVSKGDGHNNLIQTTGENWRVQKESQRQWTKWIVPGVLILIVIFHLVTGGHKLEHRSGKKIKRFSLFERILHWFVAITFLTLALTGLTLLLGRELLLPLFGGAFYASLAYGCKVVHNYVGPAFLTALVIMCLFWVRHNIPKKHDIKWLAKAGGMLSNSAPPPADKMNAGEKIWFWMIFFIGIFCVGVTGVIMDFPNLGADRWLMQWSNTIHTLGSVLLTVASFGHIYLGTKGVEGTFEGMATGYVDENWAREHHSLWYEKVK